MNLKCATSGVQHRVAELSKLEAVKVAWEGRNWCRTHLEVLEVSEGLKRGEAPRTTSRQYYSGAGPAESLEMPSIGQVT